MNKLRTVSISLPERSHGYDVLIEPGMHAVIADRIADVSGANRFALICDEVIADGPGGDIEAGLQASGGSLSCVATVKADEQHKSLDTVSRLLQMLAEARHERHEPVLALGGGITGDIAGFAAATYHRGTPFYNIPTTLLAMVDAAVGGKTGVNLVVDDSNSDPTLVKNVVGAFHQPGAVFIDPGYLHSLPMRHIRAGLAECVKHAVLADEGLFDWMSANCTQLLSLDEETLAELIERNTRIKAGVVMADEREQAVSGGRALLNLGHTFAHALEPEPSLDLVHGEAVGLGILAATHVAISLGRCDRPVLRQTSDLLAQVGLPTSVDRLPDMPQLIDAMRRDKKVRQGRIRLVLPTRIGAAITVDDVAEVVVEAAVRSLVTA